MINDLNLNSMAYFEAVARLGQVAKAAAELGVSPSAVSQQVRAIEQQFGVKLFRREGRRLILTMDGERLYRAATQAFHALRDARATILRQREQRQLILRVSPSFGQIWLAPRLSQFLTQHDGWDTRIDATTDLSDFQTEAVDFDLRYGAGDWSGLYVEPILEDHVLPLCSPAYRDWLRGLSADPLEQISRARLIDNVKGQHPWDLWMTERDIARPSGSTRTGLDRSQMSLQLARDGMGLAMDSVTLAHDDLKAGRLVPLDARLGTVRFPAYWLVCPPRHTNRRVVRLFFDWIRDEAAGFQKQAASLMQDLGLKAQARLDDGAFSE
ncbi:LysR substrate-binding domain-containing protein [Paracoccus tegillarcae]|uniref:Transcriptional regulator n=1 Tax=Paracoccus tegillarcae TaxID=1529068 RepID=A0A2K9EBG9_9RHOB|nr:LysR substrate-binding domain-containing protein [Paracoccus tegillarcae]AUH32240.1 transcriptional regulator [Paracoccus tegillarcae]